MALGVRSAQHGKKKQTASDARHHASLAPCVFLVIKYFEYAHKFHDGLLPGTYFHRRGHFQRCTPRRASSSRVYFMMTGIHGLHVLIGIGVLILDPDPQQRAASSRSRVLHARRGRGPLLAPRRPGLDLPLPAALPDRLTGVTMSDAHAHGSRPRQRRGPRPARPAAHDLLRTSSRCSCSPRITVGVSYIDFGAVNLSIALLRRDDQGQHRGARSSCTCSTTTSSTPSSW